MLTKLLLCAGLFTIVNVASAQLTERAEPLAISSPHVPVDLNALANDQSTLDTPATQVVVNNIPFNLAQNGENNNLFLHNAGWPDWGTDPRSFYSVYDDTPKEPTDTLPVVQVPTDDYSAVYVLASAEEDPKYSNILSLRIGAKRRNAQTTYHDYEFEVPRRGEKTGPNVVRALTGANAGIFLMRLPLHAAFSQEFNHHRMLDVEITKKLRLSVTKPDAARYQYRPLGLPSGVRIYGMTFERSPLRMTLEGSEIGNVFNEPQTPTFALRLAQMDSRRLREPKITARATDYYGNAVEFPDITRVPLPNFQTQLQFPVSRRGYYVLDVTVADGDRVLLERQTTFAVLPPDTRRHRETSPFGTWDFGGAHYTPNNPDITGPLYVKAGLRYGMFNATPEDRKRYGIIKGNDAKVNSRTDLSKLDDQIAAIKATGEHPGRWLLFHEDSISGPHVTRTPDLFTGKNYQLNEAEKKRLDEMINIIKVTVPKVRAAWPDIQIYLGNGMPHLMEEFLRHELPAEMFDVLGNESATFQRLPESQPTDFVANNPSIWMEHELLKHYGYEGKGVAQAYETMYPNTNPGNLTLSNQANYLVRNIMHSLAWEVPVIRFAEIVEPGNSYHFSNWGGAGLMFGQPNVSPKPSYVATATLTQMLDGAEFNRIIPTGTTTVYAFEFKKPNGEFVTCLWTPNAPRNVILQTTQPNLTVTGLMFNQRVLRTANNNVEIAANTEPVFIESAQPLRVQAGATIPSTLPQENIFTISPLNDVAQWEVINEENNELEAFNFMQPRRKGTFEFSNVDTYDGKPNPLEVKPVNPNDEKWWLPEYSQLRMRQPVTIEGQPTHIGLMVNGNGGWGRIVFELEDAAGQRWISLGTEQTGEPNPWLADWLSPEEFAKLDSGGVSDWNSNDVWGRSMINFAGWRYVQFPLPGNYPGEGYHWPYTSQWRCVKADGTRGDYIVHYPLKFTKLAVTARSRVLYGNEVVPVRRPEIYLKDLSVTYGDPDTVFWKPDPGQK